MMSLAVIVAFMYFTLIISLESDNIIRNNTYNIGINDNGCNGIKNW